MGCSNGIGRLTLSGVACLIAAQNGYAQGAAERPRAAVELEEVVVTARKQEESLQSTPVAVTAVLAESLETQQVTTMVDLQRTAPSLIVATGAPSASGFTWVTIRGQTNLQPGVAADPAIGTYIDGVYVARPSQGLFNLEDLQRVEVLRGPQGTLFGRNTTGGAVSIITADPTGDFFVSGKAEYGNENYYSVGATLNAPIKGDELGARLTYSYSEHDGYGSNLTQDRPVTDEQGNHFARGKLRFAPAEAAWDMTLSADYNEQRNQGQMIGLMAFDPAIPASIFNAVLNDPANPLAQAAGAFGLPPFDVLPYLQAQNLSQYVHTEDRWQDSYGNGFSGDARKPKNTMQAYGGAATLNVDMGWARLKSITGYRYSESVGFIDLDGTPLSVLATESGYESKQWSEELQLSGGTDPFTWITGVYYSREKGKEFSDFQTFAFLPDYLNDFFAPVSAFFPPGLYPFPPTAIARNDADVKNTSTGAFAQIYYNFTDRLRLAAGFRYTWDEREVKLHNIANINAPSGALLPPAGGPNCQVVPDGGDPADCTQTNKENFSYPAWILGVDYQATDDIFLYANTSGASMAGGWNLRVGTVPAFDPEKVRAVELGIKADLLDRRLRANLAVFHSWQSDVQRNVSTVVDVGGTPQSTQYVRNAGDAQVDGVELELTALPWEGMQLTASASFLDSSYDSGTFEEQRVVNFITGAPVPDYCQLGVAGVPVSTYTCNVDRSDEPLPAFPKRTFSAGATQTWPLAFGSVSLHADYAYVSSRVFSPSTAVPGSLQEPAASAANAYSTARSYGLFNARISLQFDEPQLELALWGRNLGDKDYVTRTFPDLYAQGLGFAARWVGEPRLYGVSVAYKFGDR